jgi:hypothetical protein
MKTNEQTFQARVQPWMMACFGAMIAGDAEERNHRFLEESLELVQACGCTATEAHQLVDYVYGRAVGEKVQEAGGVMVTLAALCLAQGLDMHDAGEKELARIWTKVEQIRAKQAAKPKYSPLPAASTPDLRPHLEWALRRISTSLDKGEHWEAARTALDGVPAASEADFKNFHRALCERFDYCHDERDWKRDQVSLIEHIAKKVASDAEPCSKCGAPAGVVCKTPECAQLLKRTAPANRNPLMVASEAGAVPDGWQTVPIDPTDFMTFKGQEVRSKRGSSITEVYGAMLKASPPAPVEAGAVPVAWRHSKTMCLYETEEEVPLADGDEWAEPLYAAPPAPVEAVVPDGYALVPLRPNAEMARVMAEPDWQWQDVLAAAEAVTEDQYNAIAAPSDSPAQQETVADIGKPLPAGHYRTIHWPAPAAQGDERAALADERALRTMVLQVGSMACAKGFTDETNIQSAMNILRAALSRQPSAPASAGVPAGYRVKHVDGQIWRIKNPKGVEWVAFDGTPAGDLIAALAAAKPEGGNHGE